jgi:hypothetical protein
MNTTYKYTVFACLSICLLWNSASSFAEDMDAHPHVSISKSNQEIFVFNELVPISKSFSLKETPRELLSPSSLSKTKVQNIVGTLNIRDSIKFYRRNGSILCDLAFEIDNKVYDLTDNSAGMIFNGINSCKQAVDYVQFVNRGNVIDKNQLNKLIKFCKEKNRAWVANEKVPFCGISSFEINGYYIVDGLFLTLATGNRRLYARTYIIDKSAHCSHSKDINIIVGPNYDVLGGSGVPPDVLEFVNCVNAALDEAKSEKVK